MKTDHNNTCVINFEHKASDRFYISSAFPCQDITLELCELFQTEGNIPVSAMKLTLTICNKILNYRVTAQAICYEWWRSAFLR